MSYCYVFTAAPLSRVGFYLLLLISCIPLFFAQANPQQLLQPAAPSVRTMQATAQLESELDKLLGANDYPADREAFTTLLAQMSDDTTLETQIRAYGFQVRLLAQVDKNIEAALKLAEELVSSAQQSTLPGALTEALTIQAEVYLHAGDSARSMGLLPPIELQLKRTDNNRIRFSAHQLIGRVLHANSQYAEALQHLLQAHSIASQLNDKLTPHRRQYLNILIARIQIMLKNYTAAVELLDSTIDDSSKHQLTSRLPELHLLRGFAVQHIEGPSDEVVNSFINAAVSAEKEGNGRVHMLGYNNAGAALLLMQRYSEAATYLKLGRDVAIAIGNTTERSIMEFNLGYIKVLQGEHQAGLIQMYEAEQIFRSFAQPLQIAELLTHVANAYEAAGMYQQQAQTLKEQAKIRQEFFQTERDRVFSELQIRYQAQENALQIQLLKQQTELQQQQLSNRELGQRVVLLIVLLIIIMAALLLLAYINSRRRNDLLNRTNQALHQQSLLDPLTGLSNRRAVQDIFASNNRRPSGAYALFLLDIDRFKQINDQFGHAVGDKVLLTVAQRLKTLCRNSDQVIRWGGEEFLLLLKDARVDILAELAARLLDDIGGEPIDVAGSAEHHNTIKITISGGYLSLPLSGAGQQLLSWESALKLADNLLYKAKHGGRNQIIGLHSLQLTQRGPLSDRQLLAMLNTADAELVVTSGPT